MKIAPKNKEISRRKRENEIQNENKKIIKNKQFPENCFAYSNLYLWIVVIVGIYSIEIDKIMINDPKFH